MVREAAFLELPNCRELTNDTVEVVVTTDIGPRILHYGFRGAENILGLCPPGAKVATELGDWRPIGGHRLWTAPEAIPRSYVPDSGPVRCEKLSDFAVRLVQPVEAPTGIQKEMTVTLDPAGAGVTVLHRITNKGAWGIEVAPWALTIMNGGGTVIIPQEPFRSHDDCLLPARPMVLWRYTDLSDPRFTLGPKYLRLRTDDSLAEPQKIGVADKQGWAAYLRQGTLFVKQFPYKDGQTYPDCGCNCESYTAGSFIELESLGPMRRLESGQSAEHTEEWHLFENVEIGDTEESLDRTMCGYIRGIKDVVCIGAAIAPPHEEKPC
ncbi:MAG TPA: hypothetical protein VNE39_29510 [Planctomycetota bacterium]|nr:hypothetical protein [Planctomycetota bacterium]